MGEAAVHGTSETYLSVLNELEETLVCSCMYSVSYREEKRLLQTTAAEHSYFSVF